MNITVEKQPECVALLTCEVLPEQVAKERKGILKAFNKEAKIPGFRPGKIPTKVLEKRFGKAIKEELESRLINEACRKALTDDESLKVLHFKAPESIDHKDDGSFAFSMTLVLAPEFDLPDYKEIEVKVPPTECTDEELQTELDGLLERYAEYNDIEDRGLQSGDIAVIDYKTTLDGEPLDDSVGILAGKEDYWVRLQEDAFLPTFSEQLEGAKKDETREVTCRIGDDFPAEELRGKEVVITVTVKAIKEQVLPTLDDAFVTDTLQFGPDKTVEDLKTFISEEITKSKTRQINESKVNQIVETLLERVDFDIAKDIVDAEAQATADEMVARAARAGLDDEAIAKQQAEIIATAQVQGRNNVKTNFILQKIAEKEEITVSDQDLGQRLYAMAQEAKKPFKKYIKELQKNGQIDNVRNSVLIGKVIDFLVDNATVTEVDESSETSNEESSED